MNDPVVTPEPVTEAADVLPTAQETAVAPEAEVVASSAPEVPVVVEPVVAPVEASAEPVVPAPAVTAALVSFNQPMNGTRFNSEENAEGVHQANVLQAQLKEFEQFVVKGMRTFIEAKHATHTELL